MRSAPVLVLFCGGMHGTPIEEALGQALYACARDTLDEALATGAYDGAILVVDAQAAAFFDGQTPATVVLDIDRPGEGFHFGRRLSEVIRRHELQRPVYVGCGLPLIKGDELAAVAGAIAASERAVVSNNFFSADLVGFVPGGIVDEVELPDNDRILPRLLTQAGLANQSLPRTMANQFDLDTPGDLAILACAGGAGPHLSRHIESSPSQAEYLMCAARLFTDNQAEVLVAGRVGSQVWQYLEAETACRIRLYSEERGMQAAGRDTSFEARSILAFHLQAVGPRRFFEELAQMVHAAFIDTRPLFAHLGLAPSRPDRFLCDAMQPDAIADPWLREFTQAALEAPIPVALGGSTLVTSGVQLLNEAVWRERDAQGEDYKAVGRARNA